MAVTAVTAVTAPDERCGRDCARGERKEAERRGEDWATRERGGEARGRRRGASVRAQHFLRKRLINVVVNVYINMFTDGERLHQHVYRW